MSADPINKITPQINEMYCIVVWREEIPHQVIAKFCGYSVHDGNELWMISSKLFPPGRADLVCIMEKL